MKTYTHCPLCQDETLQTLKEYEFSRPVNTADEPPLGQGHVAERLWIYFRHLLGPTDPTSVTVEAIGIPSG